MGASAQWADMHTPPLVSSLVLWVLKVIGDRGVKILEVVDWEPLGEVLRELESGRGRPFQHPRLAVLKGLLYGYANRNGSVLQVWKCSTRPFIRRFLGFDQRPSYDTYRRFLEQAEPLMDQLLQEVVKQCREEGLIQGRAAAMDTTALPTMFKSDSDARWNWDASREEHYFGYALHAVLDPRTQLPVAADLLRSKKLNLARVRRLWKELHWKPDLLLADSEYDILEFLRLVHDRGTLPVVEYNPRNTVRKLPVRFRTELRSFKPREWLDREYRKRAEVEHGFSTLMELGLRDFRVRGFRRVKSHCFLQLIKRLGWGLAVDKEGGQVRKTLTAL